MPASHRGDARGVTRASVRRSSAGATPCALRSICPQAGLTYALLHRTTRTQPGTRAMESLLLWYFLLAAAAGMIASLGERSWWAFFGISLLFTPAVGIVLALFAAAKEPPAQASIVDRLTAREFRKCPHCAELVRRDATRCKFCGNSMHAPAIPGRIPNQGTEAAVVKRSAAVASQAATQHRRAVAGRAS